ncbi:MAG: hypothetical protein A2014_06955 [Spirochaetes bacterium GWF1_49_6]|nr:MAG: hypothetical protein A2014_06955 [Spirochaetes bacterium GWF1_49_6]
MPEFQQIDYHYILDEFGENKLSERFKSVYDLAVYLIKTSTLTNYVRIHTESLDEAILDYFTDIHRLKKFHGIDKCNASKVAAYLSYWILKHKPIQINETVNQAENGIKKRAMFINESLALSLLYSFSFDLSTIINRDSSVLSRWNDLTDNLLYTFKFRTINPGHLEMIILALYADPIYEKIDSGE